METLRTDRLDLVPLDPERDAESLHAMYGDPRFYFYGPPETTADVSATRARLVDELTRSGGWMWSLRLRPNAEAIGTIGLFADEGTPIRGLSWGIAPRYWGRGLTGEAARTVVDHLLAQPGIDGVEAWIDTRNVRSLGVARRARLDERARLPRVYDDHTAQQVVMARAAEPRDSAILAVRPCLPVRDVTATGKLLIEILGATLLFDYGDPPTFARLGTGPWSGAAGIDLRQVGEDDIAAAMVAFDIGVPTDEVHQRAVAAGLTIMSAPEDQPWYRREFVFQLPEGHQLRVIGPNRLVAEDRRRDDVPSDSQPRTASGSSDR